MGKVLPRKNHLFFQSLIGILLLVSSFLLQAGYEDEIAIIQLNNRSATEIEKIIIPFLNETDTVKSFNNQLIIG